MEGQTQTIPEFYKGKNIFITGATGFVGISLLEKILSDTPEHGNIYILVRPKKGQSIEDRLAVLKKNSVFETLLSQRATESVDQIFEKVIPVAGDVGQDNLGLSDSDLQTLKEKVNVIFHSAATLDFGDTLRTTIDINLLGTRRVTELAKQCRNLKVLIHVSSAYVNSFMLSTEEVLYPVTKDADELLKLAESLSPEQLEEKTPEILGEHPNTYTYTKQLAEYEVKKCEKLFPCTIVRPSMSKLEFQLQEPKITNISAAVVGAWKRPVPGWTISKNGPQGFILGASKGVIRRLPLGKDLIYDYIPVDVVVNTLMVAGYRAGVTRPEEMAIYHCTSSTRMPFRWAEVENLVNSSLHKYPLISAVWWPRLKFVNSITYYRICSFFVHILPAVILDNVTRLSGGRPILMKLHRNVNSSLGRLERFIFTEWEFKSTKTEELSKLLTEETRSKFYVDLSDLSWSDFFEKLVFGARIYLSKDPEKTLKAAKTKDKILLGAHICLKLGVISFIWFVLSLIFNVTMWRSPYFLLAGMAFEYLI
ncbi:hypothetical protein YQE_08332, partial [Dendroctonus ponderosae]